MFDFNLCELCALTVLLAIVLSALHLEDDDLVTLYKRLNHFTYYLCTAHGGCTYLYCAFFVNEQHLLEFNSLTLFRVANVVNKELFALFCLKLLTVNLYNCVHYLLLKRFFRKADRHRATTYMSLHGLKSDAKVLLFDELSMSGK